MNKTNPVKILRKLELSKTLFRYYLTTHLFSRRHINDFFVKMFIFYVVINANNVNINILIHIAPSLSLTLLVFKRSCAAYFE